MDAGEGLGPNPGGLCMCGCGERTELAASSRRDGTVRGKPQKFRNNHHRRGKALEERFWSKVTKAGVSECWEWSASRTPKGYGQISDGGGGMLRAHRVAWELANGRAVPDGLSVCHGCDNPPCVNPAHLSLGTNADNIRDKVERGRAQTRRGEACPTAVLTEEGVRRIRSLHAQGWAQRKIAQEIGVSHGAVRRVLDGSSWRHVE